MGVVVMQSTGADKFGPDLASAVRAAKAAGPGFGVEVPEGDYSLESPLSIALDIPFVRSNGRCRVFMKGASNANITITNAVQCLVLGIHFLKEESANKNTSAIVVTECAGLAFMECSINVENGSAVFAIPGAGKAVSGLEFHGCAFSSKVADVDLLRIEARSPTPQPQEAWTQNKAGVTYSGNIVNPKISRCRLEGGRFALSVAGALGARILNCSISNSVSGIRVINSANNAEIDHCEISGSKTGSIEIGLACKQVRIQGCTIRRQASGTAIKVLDGFEHGKIVGCKIFDFEPTTTPITIASHADGALIEENSIIAHDAYAGSFVAVTATGASSARDPVGMALIGNQFHPPVSRPVVISARKQTDITVRD